MDTVNLILDWAGAVLLLAGAVLCLLAAIAEPVPPTCSPACTPPPSRRSWASSW